MGITKKDVRKAVEGWYDAYNTADIDAITKYRLGFEAGYGFRTLAPRRTDSSAPSEQEVREMIILFFEQFEYLKIRIDELNIETHNTVGIAWGYHTEEFQIKGQQPVEVRVRFTQTFHADADGQIRTLLSHRDIQKFDQDGTYVL